MGSPDDPRLQPQAHDLKTWPEFFALVASGRKTFELRKNDRNFRVYDVLRLREWDPSTSEYTGRTCLVRITYIATSEKTGALKEGYVCMGIQLIR